MTEGELEDSARSVIGASPTVATAFDVTPVVGQRLGQAGGSDEWSHLEPYLRHGALRVSLTQSNAEDDARLLDRARAAGWSSPVLMTSHVQHGTSADPAAAGGVVRLAFMTRPAQLSRDEFVAHWLRTHAPLVVSLSPRFSRYVAHVPASPCPWDGITEQWFDDEATWSLHDRETTEDKPAVIADIASFVGHVEQLAATPTAIVRLP
jgi:hypothetical protein